MELGLKFVYSWADSPWRFQNSHFQGATINSKEVQMTEGSAEEGVNG